MRRTQNISRSARFRLDGGLFELPGFGLYFKSGSFRPVGVIINCGSSEQTFNMKEIRSGMKKLLFLIVPFGFMMNAAGQSLPAQSLKNIVRPEYKSEACDAFEDFDFKKITINPNNLTERKIKELEANFPPGIRQRLIGSGKYPERLARLAAPVFRFHRTLTSRTVVFNSAVPTVFTWKETFVTFSSGALDLLTDAEVTALIAHEIGHLYFAEALAAAFAEGDERQARLIELKCDLVALTTLTELKSEVSNLSKAIKKLIDKRGDLQTGSFQAGSPALASRAEIIRLYQSPRRLCDPR